MGRENRKKGGRRTPLSREKVLRISYYGFLANCHRKAKLTLCRQLLATTCSLLLPQPADCRDLLAALLRTNSQLCPQCGKGILIRLQFFPPSHGPVPLRVDSS